MTNNKNTKRALTASVLSIILCIVMLIGTTFAWFTDSVTSSGNKIVAGNLEIDLIHVGGDNGKDISIKENPKHKIFDYKKWEPGYTAMETLRVVNKDNLALKFRLDAETDGAKVGANGEKLADVIDVYVYEGEGIPTTRPIVNMTVAEGWRNAGTLSSLMADENGVARGELKANATAQMTVALYMQETAGNEYQDLSLGDLNFYLSAAQYTYENDSFGNDYDTNATYPWDGHSVEPVTPDADGNYSLATAENLAWFAEEINNGTSFAGKTIKLTNNINLNSKKWPVISEKNGNLKNVVIDGNGHTIKNLYAVDHLTPGNDGYGCAFISSVSSPITVKNLTFDNLNVGEGKKYNVVGGIFGYAYGTTVFDNVHVINSKIRGYGKVGAFVGMGADPGVSITFRNCSSVNNKISAYYNAGGLAGNILRKNGVDNTVIDNCIVSGNKFVDLGIFYVTLNGEEAIFTDNDLKDGTPIPRAIYGKYWHANGSINLYAAWGEYYCSYGNSKYDPDITVEKKNGTKKDYKIADSEICVNELP